MRPHSDLRSRPRATRETSPSPPPQRTPGEKRGRALVAALLVVAALLLGACASGKTNRAWQPGDTIICPHCGREFAVPEKLGK